MEQRLRNPEPALEAVADKVVMPALGRNYVKSGLRSCTGRLFDGITLRGATGNYVRVTGAAVTVGVDYARLPYARWALEGRGVVRPRRAKVLRWVDCFTGKVIFAMKSKATPPHAVYTAGLDVVAMAEARALVGSYIMGRK